MLGEAGMLLFLGAKTLVFSTIFICGFIVLSSPGWTNYGPRDAFGRQTPSPCGVILLLLNYSTFKQPIFA